MAPPGCRRGFGMGAHLPLSASRRGGLGGGQRQPGALGAHTGGCVCFLAKGKLPAPPWCGCYGDRTQPGHLNKVRACPSLCAGRRGEPRRRGTETGARGRGGWARPGCLGVTALFLPLSPGLTRQPVQGPSRRLGQLCLPCLISTRCHGARGQWCCGTLGSQEGTAAFHAHRATKPLVPATIIHVLEPPRSGWGSRGRRDGRVG